LGSVIAQETNVRARAPSVKIGRVEVV